MNLADALLLPQDDLALAVALKSPLFGLDDDDLFALAWDRKGSLRATLSKQAMTDPKFQEALKRLEDCEQRFTQQTPFAFYAWLLGGDGGRRRILTAIESAWRRCFSRMCALSASLSISLNLGIGMPREMQRFSKRL